LFELNERESADVRARVAAVDARYVQLGILHPKEVAEARYGGSEWSMELTLDPSVERELPDRSAPGTQRPQVGSVPPGGRDPMDEQNGTLPMDGSREVEDSAGLYQSKDLEAVKEDTEFTDNKLHAKAVSAAKAKFRKWPSAVAGAYVTKLYKELYKRKHGKLEGAFKGKKEKASYFKEDAIVPLETSGMVLGDIEKSAYISEQDVEEAILAWREESPEKFKEILEAKEE
jgi:hypothetical protein